MEHFSWSAFDCFDWESLVHSRQTTPRMFVRRWLGIEHLSEQEIQKIESRRGYRTRCIHLIATVLGIDPRCVDAYGAGIDFEKMPERNRQKLAIALLARESASQIPA